MTCRMTLSCSANGELDPEEPVWADCVLPVGAELRVRWQFEPDDPPTTRYWQALIWVY